MKISDVYDESIQWTDTRRTFVWCSKEWLEISYIGRSAREHITSVYLIDSWSLRIHTSNISMSYNLL